MLTTSTNRQCSVSAAMIQRFSRCSSTGTSGAITPSTCVTLAAISFSWNASDRYSRLGPRRDRHDDAAALPRARRRRDRRRRASSCGLSARIRACRRVEIDGVVAAVRGDDEPVAGSRARRLRRRECRRTRVRSPGAGDRSSRRRSMSFCVTPPASCVDHATTQRLYETRQVRMVVLAIGDPRERIHEADRLVEFANAVHLLDARAGAATSRSASQDARRARRRRASRRPAGNASRRARAAVRERRGNRMSASSMPHAICTLRDRGYAGGERLAGARRARPPADANRRTPNAADRASASPRCPRTA